MSDGERPIDSPLVVSCHVESGERGKKSRALGMCVYVWPAGRVALATGTVKWFNEQKGYGFILPDDGGRDVFVHRTNVETDARTLQDNDRVEYEPGEGRKGPEALRVRPL